jgi:hypothetical protein
LDYKFGLKWGRKVLESFYSKETRNQLSHLETKIRLGKISSINLFVTQKKNVINYIISHYKNPT